MRHRMRMMLLAALTAAALGAGPAGKVPEGDLARLQGQWTASAGPKKDIPVVLTIEGASVTVQVTTPQGLKVRAAGEIRLDETTRPRALDWVHFTALDGQDMPEILGIYELDGDTLRVCNGGPNNNRPTEFKPGDGALADVLVFKRLKSKEAGK
ncbi:MAG: TIGR03067 domain-containing protein [Isosphaeraceae bacterium]|nr:TIGR03067 domain-containing protein [Isosphaeraceae bacterium]